MPAAAVVGAVVAIGVAAEVGTTFAIIAAVGATVGAVGAVTGVKELQYAGAAIGAVGAIGGIASSLGLFGEAAAGLGGAAGAAGEAGGVVGEAAGFGSWMGDAASMASSAVDAGSGAAAAASAAPITAGYADVGALIDAQGLAAPVESVSTSSIIDAVNGTVQAPAPDAAVAFADAPQVTPDALTPAADSARATIADIGVEAPPVPEVSGRVEVAGLPPEQQTGLINSAEPPPVDQWGRPVVQGGGEGGTLGTTSNPAADAANINPPTGSEITGSTQPSSVTGTPQPSGIAGSAEANLSGFGSAQGPLDPAQLVSRTAQGLPITADAGSSGGTWSKIMGFVKDNPTLMYGAMQAAGSFLSGALSPLPQAQVEALASQAEQNRAAANLYNQQQAALARQMSNMSQPLPTARRTGGISPGLINSPVTGVPA